MKSTNIILVFEGKDKADRVNHAVEKGVIEADELPEDNKAQASPVHVEEVKEKSAV